MLVIAVSAVSAVDVNSTEISSSDLASDEITEYADVSINVKVDYEYSSDVNTVEPDFYVSANDKDITFTKTYNSTTNNYELKLLNQSSISDSYNITAMTTGYLSNSQIINSIDNTISFNLKATDAYKLGRDLTISADKLLDFKNADDVLVVTSAGVAKLNGKTSEEAIEGVLNYDDTIGYTDVLILRDTAVDPIDFAFITKTGNKLNVVVYENASKKYSYFGTISQNMSRSEWNKYYNSLSGENAWTFASLANGWAAGVSREVLQEAAFHGHICEGTLGGYSIVKALLKYYPPVQETSMGGGSPGDITSYKILGVPGGSDDDAAMFFLDGTIGKIGYVGIDTTATGVTENTIGFIRWFGNAKTGDLIIMTFDSNKTKADFKAETGIDPDAGSLEELKYDTWWINKINNNPENLVTFLYEFTGLNEEQYYYLMGTAKDVEDNHGHSIQAIDSHGLDLEYILSLNLTKATRTTQTKTIGTLSDSDMKQIGIDAAKKGVEIYQKELGITVGKDDVDFAVFTSAGYVYLDNQETVLVRDGLHETIGTSLYSKNMLQYHQALWKPLWFAFIMRNPGSDDVYAAYIRYNTDGTWFVGNLNGSEVVNIGIDTLNNSDKLRQIEKSFIPDGNWFSIQTIANAWKSDPEFDQILSFLYHNHVCPGVQPGFFITEHIQNNFPLNENESYTYIASSTYCKDDSLTYLLGISPGLGTYIVQKLPEHETDSAFVDGATDEGAIVIWDDVNKVGRVAIVSFKWPVVDTSMYSTSEARRATQIQAFIDYYKGNPNEHIKEDLVVETNEEKWINEEQFNTLKSGSDQLNTLTFIKNLPIVSREDIINANNADNENTNSSSSNTNTNTNNYNSGRTSSSSSRTRNTNVASVAVGTTTAATAAISSVDSQGSNEPNQEQTTQEPSESSQGSDAKAYELSETQNNNSNSRNILFYIGSIVVLGGLAGYGFMRFRKNK